MTSTNTSNNKVTEGNAATFTISRTKNSGNDAAATGLCKDFVGTADEDDFETVIKHAIEFKSNELTKTFTVNTKEDGVSDDGEYFTLELYKTESDLEMVIIHLMVRLLLQIMPMQQQQ